MKYHQELLQLIKKYEEFVHAGNHWLQASFGTQLPPLLAKRKGIIPSSGKINYEGVIFAFHFHGMGCFFDFDGVQVDFDYVFTDFVYRGFDPRKLGEFIQSYPKASAAIKTQEIFEQALLDLEAMGSISRKEPSSSDTYTYVLKNLST